MMHEERRKALEEAASAIANAISKVEGSAKGSRGKAARAQLRALKNRISNALDERVAVDDPANMEMRIDIGDGKVVTLPYANIYEVHTERDDELTIIRLRAIFYVDKTERIDRDD